MRLAVLISGNGSNAQTILKSAKVSVVIASREKAYGRLRARRLGIPVETLPLSLRAKEKGREAENWILEKLAQYKIQKVFLAGFMKILSTEFFQKFKGEIYNIHPSLLPKHKGADGFRSAMNSGDEKIGVTIHKVTAELDGGPIVSQQSFDVPTHRDMERTGLLLHIFEQKLILKTLKRITCPKHLAQLS